MVGRIEGSAAGNRPGPPGRRAGAPSYVLSPRISKIGVKMGNDPAAVVNAGPEMDRAVAGALGATYREGWRAEDGCWKMAAWYYGDEPAFRTIPAFSTDLNAAFVAAERVSVSPRGFGDWEMSTYVGRDGRGWTCQIGDSRERSFANEPALAICRAILNLR